MTRHVLTTLLLLAFVVAMASAQPLSEKGRRTQSAGPVLGVGTLLVDFDGVSPGSSAVDSFIVVNTGTDSLHLAPPTIIGRDARDFRILYPTTAIAIPRSRFIRIVVECAPVDSGCRSAGILLASDGGTDTVLVNNCSLDSVPPTSIALLPFDDVPVGECVDRVIGIFNPADTSVEITGVSQLPSGSPFTLLSAVPTNGFTIPPLSSVQLAFRFCPTAEGLVGDVIHLIAGPAIYEIDLYGNGLPAEIAIDPPAIDFGEVPLGGYRDSSFTITNNGSAPATVLGQEFTPSAFSLAPSEPAAFTIPAGGSRSVAVRFRPTSAPTAFVGSDTLRGLRSARGVLLSGRGIEMRRRLIWLDSSDARVGEIAPLRLRVSPPLVAADGVDSLRVRLRYAPDALFLQSAPSAAGVASVARPADGETEITIAATAAGTITGSDLLALGFLGLATGSEFNRVRIDGLDGLPTGDSATLADGLVRLEGCIIGHVPEFGRRVSIQALKVDPDGSVSIDYTAPAGARCMARVVSVAGLDLLRLPLEPGSGAGASVHLSLTGLPDGLYFVALDAAGDQSFIPIILSR